MQVHDVVVAGDDLRVARRRRDEAVEALAEVAHRQRTRGRRAADRKVQIQQLASRIVRRRGATPTRSSWTPRQHGVRPPETTAVAIGSVAEQLEPAVPLEPFGQRARGRSRLQAESTADLVQCRNI